MLDNITEVVRVFLCSAESCAFCYRQSWGGKENGFGLAECCQDLSPGSYPSSATTVHFEFYINRASKVR